MELEEYLGEEATTIYNLSKERKASKLITRRNRNASPIAAALLGNLSQSYSQNQAAWKEKVINQRDFLYALVEQKGREAQESKPGLESVVLQLTSAKKEFQYKQSKLAQYDLKLEILDGFL